MHLSTSRERRVAAIDANGRLSTRCTSEQLTCTTYIIEQSQLKVHESTSVTRTHPYAPIPRAFVRTHADAAFGKAGADGHNENVRDYVAAKLATMSHSALLMLMWASGVWAKL